MTRTATLCAFVASVSLSAQTPPASTSSSSVTVTGCVAQVQRDGSTGPKPTGTQATPETAAMEANNPVPTNRYELLDATPAPEPVTAGTAKPSRTTYGLGGHEQELAKHVGHRVEIAGTLLLPPAAKVGPKTAAMAEGVRAVQVTSVKMVGTDCSPKK